MDLRIRTIQQGRETTMYGEGRIVLGKASNYLRDSFRELLDRGHTRISLDLRGVGYIDSGGLGELIGCFTAVTRRGGRMRIVAPTARVLQLLRLTRIDEIIEITPAEEFDSTGMAGTRESMPGFPVAKSGAVVPGDRSMSPYESLTS